MVIKFAFVISLLVAFILGVHSFPEIFKPLEIYMKKHWLPMFLALVAVISVFYSYELNQRQKRLFTAQNIPLLDVTPLGVSQIDQEKLFLFTSFSVVNYSGFKALKIGIDLKYGTNNWIREWLKADEDKRNRQQSEREEREQGTKFFESRPKVLIDELKPGETKKLDDAKSKIAIIGSLRLEENVCAEQNGSIDVYVRIAWENECGHVYDEIHKYQLLCTKVDEGRSFTFIPQGIVSKKNIGHNYFHGPS